MKGNKKTFIEGEYFYKGYTDSEFKFLKMLHDELPITLERVQGERYIKMPKMHMISFDDIKRERRHMVRHIVVDNIPFMVKQIRKLTELKIDYGDWLQFGYHSDGKMYLIDMDMSHWMYNESLDSDNNYDHLMNFLGMFNIEYRFIGECLRYMHIFKMNGDTLLKPGEHELVKRLNNPNMIKRNIYYTHNTRHIQIPHENIHIYGESGNMVITSHVINPELAREYELLQVV